MSSLDSLDLDEIAELMSYPRGHGYVLHFSDAAFAAFFKSEFRVDIGEQRFQDIGTSKGKRLRSFLIQAKDNTALRALEALWRHREVQLRKHRDDDPYPNASARFADIKAKLGASTVSPAPSSPRRPDIDLGKLDALKAELIRITGLEPQRRGYAFETYLKELFDTYGLRPREPFRNKGEQIDGSFVVDGAVYLLEAKWQGAQTQAVDLRAFEGKLQDKARWARGLFLSQSGFTVDGLSAFGRGKQTVCMDGLDLYEMLHRGLRFDDVIEAKVRRAAETGWPFSPVRDLF